MKEKKKTHTHPISDHKHISKALFICFCKDTASGIEATPGPATWLTWREETVILQDLLAFCRGYTDKSKAYVTEAILSVLFRSLRLALVSRLPSHSSGGRKVSDKSPQRLTVLTR